MKKFIIAAAVFAAFIAPQAFAQNKNFTGFSAGINANFANAKAEYTVAGVGSVQSSESSQNASLQGQYGLGFGDKFVLGLGLTYGLGDLKAGTISGGGATLSTKLKENYSINIEPGYVVAASTLAYAKIAFENAKAEASGGVGSTSGSGTADLTGMGYGVGVRTMLTGKLYFQAEYLEASYDKKSIAAGVDAKGNASVISLGVGYNF